MLKLKPKFSLFSLAICCFITANAQAFSLFGNDPNTFWKFREQYVQLESQVDRSIPNQHPVQLSTEQIRSTLAAIQVERDGKQFAALSRAELDLIAEPISKALAAATPQQDVLTGTVGMHPGLLTREYRSTTARIFYLNDQLHMVFGDLHAEFDPDADRRLYPLIAGQRNTLPEWDRSLKMQPGQTLNAGKPHWLRLDLEEVAIAEATKELDKASRQELQQEVSQLKADIATMQRQPAPTADTSALQQEVSQLKADVEALRQQQTTPPPSSPSREVTPQKVSGTDDAMAERLRKLKSLWEQGLISEDQYRQKQQEILEEL